MSFSPEHFFISLAISTQVVLAHLRTGSSIYFMGIERVSGEKIKKEKWTKFIKYFQIY